MPQISKIIDFHVHVAPELPAAIPYGIAPLGQLRRRARSWLKPFSESFHKAQSLTRHLPDPLRVAAHGISSMAPLPSLLFESTARDLAESMERAGVTEALVMAIPPLTNERLLEICANEVGRFHAVVSFAREVKEPEALLRELRVQGARALKLSPAADGEAIDSARYHALIATAGELGMPVIVPTGCPHARVLYRKPRLGSPQGLSPWFEAHPKTTFVLAHMNYSEPNDAIDAAASFSNVHVDTSWQPAEIIAEAVRRLGPERVVFASDWPFVGSNQELSIQRVRDAVESGFISSSDADLILGGNARRLLALSADTPRAAESPHAV